jgi:hypothetical protein
MRIRKLADTVFTSLPDGTAVLLNIATLHYFSLNRSGAALWQEIERSNPTDLQKLAQSVSEQFEVDQAAATAQIASFLEQLSQLGFVEVV